MRSCSEFDNQTNRLRVDKAPVDNDMIQLALPLSGQTRRPARAGAFPTLLAFGGSEGGLSGGLSYADELVPQGYAVLALAYFGEAGLTTALKNIPLEYFDGALEWVRTRPEVDATRLRALRRSGSSCLRLKR